MTNYVPAKAVYKAFTLLDCGFLYLVVLSSNHNEISLIFSHIH